MILGLGAVVIGLLVLAGMSKEEPDKTLATFATSLSGRDSSQRHNAELCVRDFDGFVVGPGETFSFNKTVGPWSRDKGYRRAPTSYGGQMIDAWGGGVCQSSTTLYNAALLAGMEVSERSPHHFAPTYVEPGRDAAVAFPNIDLVFTNPYDVPVVIHAKVDSNAIRTWITGQVTKPKKVSVWTRLVAEHTPQSITVGHGDSQVIRNVGKVGFEVETYCRVDGKTRRLSQDNYDTMNRIVERSLSSQRSAQ